MIWIWREHTARCKSSDYPNLARGRYNPPLAGEIQFMSRGSVANIKANMSGSDFLGISSTISTFVFKIIGQPGIKEPN